MKMKILDSKGKIGGKISIVDLLVIVLLIACIVFVVFKLQAKNEITGSGTTFEYTVKVEGIRQVSLDALRAESKGAKNAENKKDIGEIIDVQATPAKMLVQAVNGDYLWADYPDRFDVIITLRAVGNETADGYFCKSGEQLIVGNTLGVYNGTAQAFGTIQTVTVVK